MANVTGLLIDVTPKNQPGRKQRNNDSNKITNLKAVVNPGRGKTTDVTITFTINQCQIVSIDPVDPTAISADQVFLKIKGNNELTLENKNAATRFSRRTGTAEDLSIFDASFTITSGGGKIGGPGISAANKALKKKKK